MISKKDMLVLGLVAIGGIGVASSIASTKEGGAVTGGGGFRIKPFAGIVGSNKAAVDTGDNAGTATIVLPPEPSITFPAAPTYQAPMPMYYAPPPMPMPTQETKSGGSSKVTETKKAYAAGLQKAVTPSGAATTPKSKMEAIGMMSGLGLSLAGVIPKISRKSSGGRSSRRATTKTVSVTKTKKRPRSFGFSARSLGGGWSTGY